MRLCYTVILLYDTIMSSNFFPSVIVLISGKRKSGKDYVAEKLLHSIENGQEFQGKISACVLRISAPLKQEYARIHELDFQALLSAGKYKEQYRKDMVLWGESLRQNDPGYFCRLAVKGGENCSCWIVSDCRRLSDISWFDQMYSSVSKVIKLRVVSSDVCRKSRGWEYQPGIDDSETECGLDTGVEWDFCLRNEGAAFERDFENVVMDIMCKLSQ